MWVCGGGGGGEWAGGQGRKKKWGFAVNFLFFAAFQRCKGLELHRVWSAGGPGSLRASDLSPTAKDISRLRTCFVPAFQVPVYMVHVKVCPSAPRRSRDTRQVLGTTAARYLDG